MSRNFVYRRVFASMANSHKEESSFFFFPLRIQLSFLFYQHSKAECWQGIFRFLKNSSERLDFFCSLFYIPNFYGWRRWISTWRLFYRFSVRLQCLFFFSTSTFQPVLSAMDRKKASNNIFIEHSLCQRPEECFICIIPFILTQWMYIYSLQFTDTESPVIAHHRSHPIISIVTWRWIVINQWQSRDLNLILCIQFWSSYSFH